MPDVERPYLSSPLRAREEAHRRNVLLWIGALIILSTSPVVGHHLASRAALLLAGRDHVLGVCLIALHLLLAPLHRAFHVVLLAGVAYALWDRARAWQTLRRALDCVEWSAPEVDDAFARAARSLGLSRERIRVVEGLPDPAFTAGWYTPRMYVDSALAGLLSQEELTAVLAHEAAHVERRDPLRLSLLRFLACTLFYLPALRRLADDAADDAEIAADDAAAAALSNRGPLVLASAILEIARHWGREVCGATVSSLATDGAAIGFQRLDLLDRRVRRLMGQDAAVGTHVTRRSLAGAGAALIAVWMSGLIMAHPLPAQLQDEDMFGLSRPLTHRIAMAGQSDRGVHCAHHASSPLTHLFCRGWRDRNPSAPCPHAEVVALTKSGLHPTV